MELIMDLTKEERKQRHSDYNTAWKAKHRREGTDIARRIKDKENYYANRAKETAEGYCRYFLNNIKSRCKRKGLPFNLTLEDLVIPEFCPVLGIPLIKRRGKFSDNSPSVDRTVPHLGYVKGNVSIMSYRANRIKCHASLDDLRKIVAYMEANNG
jgi:hypothetical protein